MSRLHSTLIAIVLGTATAAGLFAAVRTVRLGQTVTSSPATTSAVAKQIQSRQAKLARWSHSLERARKKHPPALPKVPKFAPVQVPKAPPATPIAAGTAAPAAAPPAKAPTVVKYVHAPATATTTTSQSSWAGDGSEQEDGGGQSGSLSGSAGGGD
jgi:hypothetical protein